MKSMCVCGRNCLKNEEAEGLKYKRPKQKAEIQQTKRRCLASLAENNLKIRSENACLN
jgi:hypothetical protein